MNTSAVQNRIDWDTIEKTFYKFTLPNYNQLLQMFEAANIQRNEAEAAADVFKNREFTLIIKTAPTGEERKYISYAPQMWESQFSNKGIPRDRIDDVIKLALEVVHNYGANQLAQDPQPTLYKLTNSGLVQL